jgi:hypothetical protein
MFMMTTRVCIVYLYLICVTRSWSRVSMSLYNYKYKPRILFIYLFTYLFIWYFIYLFIHYFIHIQFSGLWQPYFSGLWQPEACQPLLSHVIINVAVSVTWMHSRPVTGISPVRSEQLQHILPSDVASDSHWVFWFCDLYYLRCVNHLPD